jgi:PBP1b-binding outer membrane lipoprotein LpoB
MPPSGTDMMTRILSVFVAALFLVACSDVHYSDSETSDVRDFQDDDKGEHPDEPIEE